jgi:hypothetical protein
MFFTLAMGSWMNWTSSGLHQITGDEPHYLVIADGLLPTFEIEQSGPYSREFRNRTISPNGLAPLNALPDEANTHAVQRSNGLFNVHNLGLPIILAIPYLFGGVLGARIAMLLIGGGIVYLFVVVSRSLGRDRRLSAMIVMPMVIGLPLVPASTQIYPDLPAGLACLVGLVLIARPNLERRRLSLAASSILIAFLPWLHLRFAVLAVIILTGIFWSLRREAPLRTTAIILGAPLLVSLGLLATYNHHAFGNIFGPYETEDVQTTAFTAMQFFGLVTDQNQGLFIQQPLHLAGLFMVGYSIRKRPTLIATSLALAIASLGTNSTHWSLYGGWSFNGRFNWTAFTAVATVTIVGLSEFSQRRPRLVAWMIVGATAVQLRYLFGIFLQDIELLPRSINSWVGTYSTFWQPIEEALPVWTSTADAFGYLPNLVAVSLCVALLGLGFLSESLHRLRAIMVSGTIAISIATVTVFSIVWSPLNGPRQWNGDFLPGNVGAITGAARSVSEPSEPGFLTFGPGWRTPPGQYRITIQYEGQRTDGQAVGSLDVFSRASWRKIDAIELPGTSNQVTEKVIEFDVLPSDDGQLEFRTYYKGKGALTVHWIRIEDIRN